MTDGSESIVGAVLARRYRLRGKLGEGGMGAVYVADALDRSVSAGPVAVKILHPEFLGEPEVLGRFLDEARVCQRIIHPNVVRVLDCATAEDGSPFIVMELLEGAALSSYTAHGGRVPVAQAVPILQGVLAGLAAAHAQGLVHRDLKPENVFLARDAAGQFGVKVLDFGIAKVMDVAGGMGSKTKTGALLGTPAYMSPEQVRNSKDVDVRADLWSAGVLLYEMLTGRVAFPAPTEYARLTAVLTTEPEPMDRVDPRLASFAPFLARALQKDRALRFGSALEMAGALVEAAAGVRMQGGPMLEAAPLERLPDVSSVFAPHPGRGSPVPPSFATNLPLPSAPLHPLRGGTLQSPSSPVVLEAPPAASAPAVVVVPPAEGQGSTLPSSALPMLKPVGAGAPKVPGGAGANVPIGMILVVAAALAVGFVMGFLAARSM